MSTKTGKHFRLNRYLQVEDCEDAWIGETDVTVTLETTDKKEGDGAVKAEIAEGFGTGLVMSEVISPALNLSKAKKIHLWIKSTVTKAAGVFQLKLEAATVQKELIDIPALTANIWKYCPLTLATPAEDTAIDKVGIVADSDPGVVTTIVDDVGCYFALGIVNPCEPAVNVDEMSEEGTETRKLSLLEPSLAVAGINPTVLIQRIDYIKAYAMITAEGTVPFHDLRYTDGLNVRTLKNCKVRTCEITFPFGGAGKAVMAITASDLIEEDSGLVTTPPTWESFTEKPITRKQISTLTIGSADLLTLFREVSFAVDNRVEAEGRGTGIKPLDVYEREARYSGREEFVLVSTSLMATVYSGVKQDVVVAFADRQTSPVTTTFTFTEALLKVSRLAGAGLSRRLERVEWTGDVMTN